MDLAKSSKKDDNDGSETEEKLTDLVSMSSYRTIQTIEEHQDAKLDIK